MTTYLPYRLRLQRPALLGAPTGDPNSAVTLEHIPGAAIRGAVAAAVAGNDDLIARLVLNPSIRYLNAYWEIDGQRSLPTPAHWRIEARRRRMAAFADDLAAPRPELASDAVDDSGETAAPIASGLTRLPPFWAPDADAIRVGRPQRIGRMHNSRDPERGRSWKDDAGRTHGAVFSYEAIAAEQVFAGLIALDEMGLADELVAVLPDAAAAANEHFIDTEPATIRVGRSKLAGYGGRATLHWLPIVDEEVSGNRWLVDGMEKGANTLAVLLSDAIVRHPLTGQVDPTAVPAVLAGLGWTVVRSWHFDTVTGGFNTRWGLPLPQHPAVAAGSSYLVRADRSFTSAQVAELEASGLGLRRRDGFGRFRLAAIPATERIRVRIVEPTPPAMPTGSTPPLVAAMSHRRLRQRLHDQLSRQAITMVERATVLPTTSLLGRLRTQLRSTDGLSAVRHMLSKEEIEAPARAQLNRCEFRLGSSEATTLLDGLRRLSAADRDTFAAIAQVQTLARAVAIGGHIAELTAEDIDVASRHLVDEILTALHNQQRVAARAAAGEVGLGVGAAGRAAVYTLALDEALRL